MKTWKKAGIFFVMLVSLATCGITIALAGSDFPVRPIELVIPNNPGGGMDAVASAFREKVSKILGQPVLNVYKPGAAETLGCGFVAKSKPDGYTLVVASMTSMLVRPMLKEGTGYTVDDFAPVCNLTTSPSFFCVQDAGPYKTIQDLIQGGKAKKIKYATYGAHSLGHIIMDALARAAEFQAIHIPYGGSGPAMAAVLGGHADVAIVGGTTPGMVGPGRLRIIAVTTDNRWVEYPDVPTLKELGYPFSFATDYHMWAPKGTPQENIDKIFNAYKRAAEESGDEIKKALMVANIRLNLLGPEELRQYTQARIPVLKKCVEEMGIK